MSDFSKQFLKKWLSVPGWFKRRIVNVVVIYFVITVLIEGVKKIFDGAFLADLGLWNFLFYAVVSFVIFFIMTWKPRE